MLDLTKPETYQLLLDEKETTEISYPTLVSKYNLSITPECLRFRLRAFKNEGVVKIAYRSENITQAQLQSWVDRKLSISEIYLETDIPHNFIYTACKKYNLKLQDGRKRLSNKVVNTAEIETLVKQGKDAKAVAKIVGLSYQRAKDYVNRLNSKTNVSNYKKEKTPFTDMKVKLLTSNWSNLCL